MNLPALAIGLGIFYVSNAFANAGAAPQPINCQDLPQTLIDQFAYDMDWNELDPQWIMLSKDPRETLTTCEEWTIKEEGDPAIFMRTENTFFCGAAGRNCDTWLYEKREASYVLLLVSKNMFLQDTVHHGYRDLRGLGYKGFCKTGGQNVTVTKYEWDGLTYEFTGASDQCVNPEMD